VLAILIGAMDGALGQSNIDPVQRFAWSANLGWIDARAGDGAQGAVFRLSYASGYLWSANAGWINLGDGTPANGSAYANTSGIDFGVNHAGSGKLRGLAWGASVGWIVFEDIGNPRIDLATGALSGYAWMANAGWLHLAGVRKLGPASVAARETRVQLAAQGAERGRVTLTLEPSGGVHLGFQGIPGRPGILQAAADLAPPVAWLDVGQAVADEDGALSFTDPTAGQTPQRFYRVVILY